MGDAQPVIAGSYEYIGGQDAETLGLPFHHAGNALDAGDEPAIALPGDVDVMDVEVHQRGAVEDALP